MSTVGSTAVAALLVVVLPVAPTSPRATVSGPSLVPSLPVLPPSFRLIDKGQAGGTVWQGLIPNQWVPAARRLSVVYLPPAASPDSRRYPVLYLLQGFRGSPYQYPFGLHFADVADRAIATHVVRPFIAVAPPAGINTRFEGEWTGVWEKYLVRDVVPWVDGHLPTVPTRLGRAIAGLSAGGYGAVDIALRHPDLFRTAESWSGYFEPIRDGSLAHASRAELAAHDPSLLVGVESLQLRRLGMRFNLSAGTTHDRRSSAAAVRFARELASLGLTYRLLLRPGGHDGKFWRRQLPAALQFALAPSTGERTTLAAELPAGR
jgi:enterochelin esterase-like enzyme